MALAEIAILVRLCLGALATFFAILLWSKSREAAWIFVILATLVSYAEIVVSTLEGFGIFKFGSFSIFGLPGFEVVHIALTNLPLVLFSIAFVIAIAGRRLR